MKDVLFVYFNDISASGGMNGFDITKSKDLDFIWQYDLENVNFNEYKGIILSGGVDQILLSKLSGRLCEFLENGGRVLFNGHVEKKFLPMLEIYEPVEHIKYPDFMISLIKKKEVLILIICQAVN